MMIQRAGRATWRFQQQPSVIGYASVVGKKETEGPLGEGVARVIPDSYNGCDTYEEAEARMQRSALRLAAAKCNLEAKDIDCVFAGDLLNQCIGSSFGLKNLGIPYLGQYAACATMAQSLMMAAMMVESGAVKTAACVTSSHFCAAERQYRFPLEYGSVRTPTAQWTVTGAGAAVVEQENAANRYDSVKIKAVQIGTITDLGIKDANNMGAAMAPVSGRIRP
jgi:stage V sporulation protein AD